MLLTISTTHQPATDLGYLLAKRPARCQSFDLSFGQAHVFYPEATAERCTAALLLDVDPVGMVRGGVRFRTGLLDQYVNDRPFVASSFMSVAIAQVYGSAMIYRDKRLAGFDAAAVVEVIEHLAPPRLAAFERVLFECAKPPTIVLTTVNREYNALFENLPAGKFRHSDHRFEWTRAEFTAWAKAVADRLGYNVRFLPVGPEDSKLGPPTQMAVFGQKETR